jgi:hypothetical protein
MRARMVPRRGLFIADSSSSTPPTTSCSHPETLALPALLTSFAAGMQESC